MTIFLSPSKDSVCKLLAYSELPVSDLDSLDFNHFFGYGSERDLKGIIGLELYGPVALLRSLAVAQNARGSGCGKLLVAHIESYARQQGVGRLYLLTTTAEDFFANLGYEHTDRSEAPGAIARTREFSGICPGSAAFMMKKLG